MSELTSKNKALYELERTEYQDIKSDLVNRRAARWHDARLAEVTKMSGRAAIGGYWPHIMRSWLPSPTLVVSDKEHVCPAWASHSSPSYPGYYCIVCGAGHPLNDKSSPDVCDWTLDAYYVGFYDYINRTKKLLFDALGK